MKKNTLRHLCRAILLAAATTSMAAIAHADTIRIGAILPLTGPGGAVGVAQQRGIQFAVQEANAAGGIGGDKLEVIYEDSQGKPDQSVLSFNKLVDLQHVPAILSAYSGPSLAIAPLATRKKIVVINGGAQADPLAKASPYLFNTLPVIGDEIDVLAKYLVAKGYKRAAILFENDAAGIAGRDDYTKSFTAAGGSIVAAQSSDFGQTDFRAQLLLLGNAKPDVLLVSITVGLPQFAQQYRQLNAKYLVAGTTFFNDPAVIAEPGSSGFEHSQILSSASPKQLADFKAFTGSEMEFWGRQYYNATQILITTMKSLAASKTPITGEAIRTEIFKIGHFDGVTPLEFKTNTASVGITINRLTNGHDEKLDDVTQ